MVMTDAALGVDEIVRLPGTVTFAVWSIRNIQQKKIRLPIF
jgi:hypothetical protein